MLVLTRKMNESIVIDGNISIKVVSVRGNQVRLGITAPESLAIYRSELRDRANGDFGARNATGHTELHRAVNS
jgi:carbon storage regulator